jgi:hypothetical protein
MAFTIARAMPRKKYTESSFGERLQSLREARGLTQVQLTEARRQWKRFQMIATLPERDQKAVVRLIHSLVAGSSLRKNTSAPTGAQTGDRHGR